MVTFGNYSNDLRDALKCPHRHGGILSFTQCCFFSASTGDIASTRLRVDINYGRITSVRRPSSNASGMEKRTVLLFDDIDGSKLRSGKYPDIDLARAAAKHGFKKDDDVIWQRPPNV